MGDNQFEEITVYIIIIKTINHFDHTCQTNNLIGKTVKD